MVMPASLLRPWVGPICSIVERHHGARRGLTTMSKLSKPHPRYSVYLISRTDGLGSVSLLTCLTYFDWRLQEAQDFSRSASEQLSGLRECLHRVGWVHSLARAGDIRPLADAGRCHPRRGTSAAQRIAAIHAASVRASPWSACARTREVRSQPPPTAPAALFNLDRPRSSASKCPKARVQARGSEGGSSLSRSSSSPACRKAESSSR